MVTKKSVALRQTDCRGDHWSSVSTGQVKAKRCVKTKVNSRKFSCTSVVRSDDQWSPLHSVRLLALCFCVAVIVR